MISIRERSRKMLPQFVNSTSAPCRFVAEPDSLISPRRGRSRTLDSVGLLDAELLASSSRPSRVGITRQGREMWGMCEEHSAKCREPWNYFRDASLGITQSMDIRYQTFKQFTVAYLRTATSQYANCMPVPVSKRLHHAQAAMPATPVALPSLPTRRSAGSQRTGRRARE